MMREVNAKDKMRMKRAQKSASVGNRPVWTVELRNKRLKPNAPSDRFKVQRRNNISGSFENRCVVIAA